MDREKRNKEREKREREILQQMIFKSLLIKCTGTRTVLLVALFLKKKKRSPKVDQAVTMS